MTAKPYWYAGPRESKIRLHRQSCLTTAILFCLVFAGFIGSLTLGILDISFKEAFNALFRDQGSPGSLLVVRTIRFPRAAAALVAGAALGVSGLLMQGITRNRLANPEFLGITDGATFAMVLFVMAQAKETLGPWWIPCLGGVCSAWFLVLISGGVGVRGYRILVVGIGISGLLKALGELFLSKLNLQHSSVIYNWSIGSLAHQGLEVTYPVSLLVCALLPFCFLAGRRLEAMQFGEAVAANLGIHLAFSRLWIFLTAVVLASLAVGLAGPVAFVALAAPIIASHLAGPSRIPVAGSAFTGGLLVMGADLIGRLVGFPTEIPVGVVTTLLGGPFLLWVLLKEP